MRKGRSPGIYTTWDSCAAQVKGYPGAIYKSFKTQAEAKAFMEGEIKHPPMRSEQKRRASKSASPSVDIWVDGSCIHNNGHDLQLGWAYLILDGDQELHRDSGNDIPEEARSQRNVAGEIQAVLKALDWCQAKGISSATIYHDYQGLAAWVEGYWQAKTPFTQAYVSTVLAHGMDLKWEKIVAHSGEKFNEIVDDLARDAARTAK